MSVPVNTKLYLHPRWLTNYWGENLQPDKALIVMGDKFQIQKTRCNSADKNKSTCNIVFSTIVIAKLA